MVASPEEKEFASYVAELMQSIGPVSARAMFGGYGIFLNGLMFGLIADSVLYLKADKETEKQFTAKELEQFTYSREGRTIKMSFYQAPEEAMDNSAEMRSWAVLAYEAARRSAAKK